MAQPNFEDYGCIPPGMRTDAYIESNFSQSDSKQRLPALEEKEEGDEEVPQEWDEDKAQQPAAEEGTGNLEEAAAGVWAPHVCLLPCSLLTCKHSTCSPSIHVRLALARELMRAFRLACANAPKPARV